TIGPTTVAVELSGEQPVTIGDVAFQAVCTPGHTPGSVCYFMEKDGRRVLFSGDVVWSLSAGGNPRDPLSRPLGTYTAYLPPLYRGDVDAFLATLRRLAGLPPPQIVLPGHPRNDRVPMSPVVTP